MIFGEGLFADVVFAGKSQDLEEANDTVGYWTEICPTENRVNGGWIILPKDDADIAGC